MKVTFEFDDESQNFDNCQLNRYKSVDKIVSTLQKILEYARHWEKYEFEEDGTSKKRTGYEFSDDIWEIIKEENLDVEGLEIW